MWHNQNFLEKLFWKTSYLSTSTGNAFYTPLCYLSWSNISFLYLLSVNIPILSNVCFCTSWENLTKQNTRWILFISSVHICGPQQPVGYKVWLSCASIVSIRWRLGMFMNSRSNWWSLDYSGAEYYWHCCQCMEKLFPCLHLHNGQTFRAVLLQTVEKGNN